MKHKLFLIIHLTILMTICLSGCGNSERVKSNIENSQKLKVGMTLSEALTVMGDPVEIREHASDKGVSIYYYDSPPGASDWIEFKIDSTKKVIHATPYEIKR